GDRDRGRRRSQALAARRAALPLDRRPRRSLARAARGRAGAPAASGGATFVRRSRCRSNHARARGLPSPQPALVGWTLGCDRPETHARGAGVRRGPVSVEPDPVPHAPRRHAAEAGSVRGRGPRRSAYTCLGGDPRVVPGRGRRRGGGAACARVSITRPLTRTWMPVVQPAAGGAPSSCPTSTTY